MRNWRVLTAIAAAVLSALAGVLVWQYVDEADDRAEARQELRDVLVAVARVPRGTSLERAVAAELVAAEARRVKDIPATAVLPGTEDALRDLVAVADIAPGQFVVREQLGRAGHVQGMAGLIEEGKQAVTISVDETHGVAGFVSPGDKVSVLLTLDVGDLSAPDGGRAVSTTAYLLPGLDVVAVGRTTTVGPEARADTDGDGDIDDDDVPADAGQRGLITLQVDARQAAQIAHATSQGTIYLSLHPPGFDAGTFERPEEIVEALNLFDQPLGRVDEALALVRAARR